MQANDIKVELLGLGMGASLKGTNYLSKAIELYTNNTKLTGKTGIYGVIAKEYNTTQARVERAIRHSIEVMFTRVGADTVVKRIENKFGIAIPALDWQKKPCNTEFIALINFGIEKDSQRGISKCKI